MYASKPTWDIVHCLIPSDNDEANARAISDSSAEISQVTISQMRSVK